MQTMYTEWILLTVFIWILVGGYSEGTPIRLSDGDTSLEGRVEVLHNNTWGTICDDGFNDKSCFVICRQLGLKGGKCLNEKGEYGCEIIHFGEVRNWKIWIDELTCFGYEGNIDECQKNNWGTHNCIPSESAGCKCEALGTEDAVRRNVHKSGTCEVDRHRIAPFDKTVHGVGRVEVQDENNVWGLICDDQWDDLDAGVFCACLGYQDSAHFHALHHRVVRQNSFTPAPSLPIIYDAVHCTRADNLIKQNIWDCNVTIAGRGHCNADTEAAAVSCQPLPPQAPEDMPKMNISCNGGTIFICFGENHNQTGLAVHLALNPECRHAKKRATNNGSFCYLITMASCSAVYTSITSLMNKYCYDLTYSKYDNNPYALLTESVWSVRVCCSFGKNGSADAFLVPDAIPSQAPIHVANERTLNYKLSCFRDETFAGDPITFPAIVKRGDPLYCRARVDAWHSSLFLVVHSCRFMPSANSKTGLYFFKDRCATMDSLGLVLYSFDNHNWGFKFSVPKFQGFSQLYLSCDAYVCDSLIEGKPYCDRSCPAGDGGRSVRSHSSNASRNPRALTERHIQQGPIIVSGADFDFWPDYDEDEKQRTGYSKDNLQALFTSSSSSTHELISLIVFLSLLVIAKINEMEILKIYT